MIINRCLIFQKVTRQIKNNVIIIKAGFVSAFLLIKEKQMKVYYRYTNKKEKPEIRISNKRLVDNGFSIGSEYKVIYKRNVIVLIIKEEQK